MSQKNLIVIVGPTAIGKTGLAIDIAQKLQTEIISCDSRQIYKEMLIGTARPSEEQLSKIKHHFIASQSIHDYYNASIFEMSVMELLETLFQNHSYVVMTGGSGLYVDAVCNGIDDLPTIDPGIREEVHNRFKTEGIESLRRELFKIDPEYCHTADLQNPKRIFKALEVFYMTGKPYSTLLSKTKKERPFRIIKIALNRDRQELYNTIDLRVDQMLENGLLEEARILYPFKQLNALNTVGYKEFFDYFDHAYSLEEAISLVKRNSRRYAKRQISWFQRDKDTEWFHPDELSEIESYIFNACV